MLREGNTAVGGAYALYLQARGHLQRFERAENLESAISLLQKALEQDPAYALAYAALGEAYWRLYELKKRPELVALAQDNCRKALGLNDLLAPVHVTLGMIHRGTGKGEEALADLRRALDRDPRSAEAYREMGRAERALGRNAGSGAGIPQGRGAAALGLGRAQLPRRPARRREPPRGSRGRVPARHRPRSGQPARLHQPRRRLLPPGEARGSGGALSAAPSAIRPTAAALSNLGSSLFYLGRYDEAARVFEEAVRAERSGRRRPG